MASINPIVDPVGICSMALGRLGVREITSLELSGDSVADKCRLYYDPIRKQILRDHIWNFAKKYDTISREGTEAPNFNYSAKFKLPNDYLRLVRMYVGQDIDRVASPTSSSHSRVNWVSAREADFDIAERYIYINTEENSIDIVYISDYTNVVYFDPIFIAALSAKLAAELAPGVVSKDKVALRKQQESDYLSIVQQAKGVQGTEKRMIRVEDGSFNRARRRGGGSRDPRYIHG